MSRRRRKTRVLTRCGHRARTPEEIHEEGEISEVEHLVRLLRSAGIVVALEHDQLVVTGMHPEPGPGIFAAVETLTGREGLVQKVLEGRAS
jgi:hypothetical protein